MFTYQTSTRCDDRIIQIRENYFNKVKGKKGAEAKRNTFLQKLKQITQLRKAETTTRNYRDREITAWKNSHKERHDIWKKTMALALAEKAEMYHDEHGSSRGDYLSTFALDYVPPHESHKAPYFDMGGEGLGLIGVERTRRYAKSCTWSPSSVTTFFLVGKNEAGTYFSHTVPTNYQTVEAAVAWIWNYQQDNIIQRQGDIALIRGKGPKIPKNLPSGHEVKDDGIYHATHPTIPLPGVGERIIVGRRAAERASNATRD